MSTIKLQSGTIAKFALLGKAITPDLFGVNFIFTNDRWDSSNTLVSAGSATPAYTYDDILNALGAGNAPLHTIRYPGGAVTESYLDLNVASFFSSTHNGKSITSPGSFLDLCRQQNVEVAFVMPTKRFIGTQFDSTGNRVEAVDDQLVHDFVLKLLDEADVRGVNVGEFELGNEWWLSDTGYINAIEYGRIASEMARVIQSAVDEFRVLHSKPATWAGPEIVVQIGARENASMETEQIFSQFTDPAAKRAIDGLVAHRYVKNSFEDIDANWVDSRIYGFDKWEELVAQSGDPNWKIGGFSRHISEWNLSAHGTIHTVETGLRSYSSFVKLFSEIAAQGVDQADVWAVQNWNNFDLARNSPSNGEYFRGLSFTGEAFRMMNESLRGTKVVDLSGYLANAPPSATNLSVEAFRDPNKLVFFISNRTGVLDKVSLDVASMVGSYTHVWGTVVGVDGTSNPLNANAVPTITNYSGMNFQVINGLVNFDLKAWESIRLVFTRNNLGVEMNGHIKNDYLSGSSGVDTIRGNDGHDTLLGNDNSDIMIGGSGNDKLYGGSGNDRLEGSFGNDLFDGGSGTDTAVISYKASISVKLWKGTVQDTGQGLDTFVSIENIETGAGNDRVEGTSRANMISSGFGADTLLGYAGNDTLFGGDGADQLLGGDGADRIYGGAGRDSLDGGAGADAFVFSRGDGVDTVYGFADRVDFVDINIAGLRYANLVISESSLGVTVSTGFGDSFLLSGLKISQISASDFHFL